jgi:hypothetical protein
VVEEEVEMSPLTDDLVRLEVGKLLRADYQGKTICLSCLVTFVHHSFGVTYTKAQIERAMLGVSRSPGALTYSNSFFCDHCEKVRPCLSAGRPGPEAGR